MKDVFFQISSFLFDLRCDFDKNVWFFQEIKGGTLYQNSRFSHNLNKNEDFKGRKWFVEKLKCHEILTWFGRDDLIDFCSCSWIFFNKIREKILFFKKILGKYYFSKWLKHFILWKMVKKVMKTSTRSIKWRYVLVKMIWSWNQFSNKIFRW